MLEKLRARGRSFDNPVSSLVDNREYIKAASDLLCAAHVSLRGHPQSDPKRAGRLFSVKQIRGLPATEPAQRASSMGPDHVR
jgi:hypothetical protein